LPRISKGTYHYTSIKTIYSNSSLKSMSKPPGASQRHSRSDDWRRLRRREQLLRTFIARFTRTTFATLG